MGMEVLQPTIDVDTFIHLMTPSDKNCGDSSSVSHHGTNATFYNHLEVLSESKIE